MKSKQVVKPRIYLRNKQRERHEAYLRSVKLQLQSKFKRGKVCIYTRTRGSALDSAK